MMAKQTTEIQVPKAALRLHHDVSVEQLADGGSGPRKFRMVANSGQPISHWYWGNLAIDLAGLKVGRQKRPTLREHDTDRIVGFTDRIEKTSEGLVVEGTFVDTPEAAEVIRLSDQGYPWEASMYVPPDSVERVEAGSTVEVNGFSLSGPGTVFRKSRLREVSFATLGADENTPSAALSDSDVVTVECIGDQCMDLTKLTADEIRAGRPDLVATFANEGSAQVRDELEKASKQAAAEAVTAALSADRERVAAILADAIKLGLPEDGAKLAAEDIGVEQALLRLKDAKIAALSAQAPASPGPSGEPTPPASLSDDEKWEADWSKDAKLRAEFGESKPAFFAWCRANSKGLAKVYSK